MSLFNSFRTELDKGIQGLNTGLPMGFPRLETIVPGIQRGTNYLVFGESGTGKSSFADTVFVCNPLDWYMSHKDNTDIKLDIFYFSFEISKPRLVSKLIARKIWLDYHLLLDVNYILSKGMKYRISDEHYKICMSYANYFDEASDFIRILDSSSGHNGPTGIYRQLRDHSATKGKWIEENHQQKYTENNSNQYTIIVTDHLSIIPKEAGNTVKDNIDSLISKQIILRNACNYSFVNIAQVNRAVNDIKRKDNMILNLGDIKDSGTPAEASDLAIGLLSPKKYQLDEYNKYNTKILQDRFRWTQICKNRDGIADVGIGMLFLGENGYFEELPKASEMNKEEYERVLKHKKTFNVVEDKQEGLINE